MRQAQGLTLAKGVIAVFAGDSHACAITSDGHAKCWGSNGFGELGDGTDAPRLRPAAVVGLSGASSVSSGFRHSCALVDGGRIRCWGENRSGELVNGTTIDSAIPVDVVASAAQSP